MLLRLWYTKFWFSQYYINACFIYYLHPVAFTSGFWSWFIFYRLRLPKSCGLNPVRFRAFLFAPSWINILAIFPWVVWYAVWRGVLPIAQKEYMEMSISVPNWQIKPITEPIKMQMCSLYSPIKSFESRFVPSFEAKILESSRCPFCADRWSGTCACVFFAFNSISGLCRSWLTIYN